MVYIIAIEGIIGCGKSTLMSKLTNESVCVQEPINEWSLLANFYQDMETFAAPLQFQILFSYHKIYSLHKTIHKVIIERSPWSSKNVFSSMLMERGCITREEMAIYEKFYTQIAFPIDKFIYLKVDTDVAYERILARNRSLESTLTIEYLEQLNNKYNKEFNNTSHVEIDANQSLDKVLKDVLKHL